MNAGEYILVEGRGNAQVYVAGASIVVDTAHSNFTMQELVAVKGDKGDKGEKGDPGNDGTTGNDPRLDTAVDQVDESKDFSVLARQKRVEAPPVVNMV